MSFNYALIITYMIHNFKLIKKKLSSSYLIIKKRQKI